MQPPNCKRRVVSKQPEPLSVKQNMLWNSAGSFLNLLAQWLITVLVVRISAGYDAAGLWSLAVSVYGIFQPVAQYRLYMYQVSDIEGENNVGEYFALRIITNILALIGCFGYALVTCPQSAWLTIMLYGVYKAFTTMIDVFHANDQRHHRMDYIGISLFSQGVLSLAIFTGVFWLTQNLAVTLLCMCAAIACVGIFFDWPHSNRFEKLTVGISRKKAVHLLVLCLPLVLGSIAASAAAYVPRQFLFANSGDTALGIYASVAAPVAVILNGAAYIYYPLIGYFAEDYVEGRLAKLKRLFAKVVLAIAALGAVCALLLSFLGVPLLELFFANNIGQYADLLMPVIISAFVMAFLWFLNDLLIALRDFKGNFLGNMAALVVALATMVPFVQIWGMNGVSYTAIASSLAGVIVMVTFFLRDIKKRANKQTM